MSIPMADTDSNTNMTEDEAVEALLARSEPKEPAEEPEDQEEAEADPEDEGYEGDEEDPEDQEEDPEDGEEDPEDAKEPEAKEPEGPAEIADDMVAKVKVGDEEIQVTGAQLKRLAGQEASLTQKSQELHTVGQRTANTLRAVLEQIKEDLDEYDGVDWLVEKDRMDPEWFEYHRAREAQLQDRFGKAIKAAQSVDGVLEGAQEQITQAQVQQARDTLVRDIPGWDDKLYGEVMTYGAEQGLAREALQNLIDPTVIKLLHKAMLHDKGKAVATQKVQKAPSKTVQPAGPTKAEVQTKATKTAMNRLKTSGSEDDAVAVLMGRWSRKR